MKPIALLLLTCFGLTASAQDKSNYVHFNKLTPVKGTAYVIASVENMGKMYTTKSSFLLFINTSNGQAKQVDFPGDSRIENVDQVNIDSLGINIIIVSAMTVDLDGKHGIDWNDPKQIIILSPDGEKQIQLTDRDYFVSNYTTNTEAGTLVVTGYYDSNNNGKYDKTDKNQIIIYSLKTQSIIARI